MVLIDYSLVKNKYNFRLYQGSKQALKLIGQITSFFISGSDLGLQEIHFSSKNTQNNIKTSNMLSFGLLEIRENNTNIDNLKSKYDYNYNTFIEIANISSPKNSEFRFVDISKSFYVWEKNLFSSFDTDCFIFSMDLKGKEQFLQAISYYYGNNVILLNSNEELNNNIEFNFEIDIFSLTTLYLKPIRYSFSFQLSMLNNYSWALFYSLKNMSTPIGNILNILGSFMVSLLGFLLNLLKLFKFISSLKVDLVEFNRFIKDNFYSFTPFSQRQNVTFLSYLYCNPNEIQKLIETILNEMKNINIFYNEVKRIFNDNYGNNLNFSSFGRKIISILINKADICIYFNKLNDIIFGYYDVYYTKIIKENLLKNRADVNSTPKNLQKNVITMKILKVTLTEQFNLPILVDLYNSIEPDILFILYTRLSFGKRFIFQKLIGNTNEKKISIFDDLKIRLRHKHVQKNTFYVPVGSLHYNEIVLSFKYIEKMILLKTGDKIANHTNIENPKINLHFEIYNFLQGNNLLVSTDYTLTKFIEGDLKNKEFLENEIIQISPSSIKEIKIRDINVENYFAV